jgi:hypothetical protein
MKGKILVKMYDYTMKIFKMLFHVHVHVYLEKKKFKWYKCLWKTCFVLISGKERGNEHEIHPETPTDTSTIHEKLSQKSEA